MSGDGANPPRTTGGLRSWGAMTVAIVLTLLALAAGAPVPAAAVQNPAGTSVRQAQTFYSYVKAGEHLSVSFTKIAAENRGPGRSTQ